MKRLIFILLFFICHFNVSAKSQVPIYDSDETRLLIEKLVTAHGGLDAWQKAGSFSFQFMTHVTGNNQVFYSQEKVNLKADNAYIYWPLWDAKLSWNGNLILTENWPMKGMAPGFFTKLTASFISLPWLSQTTSAKLSKQLDKQLPDDETYYSVVRLEYGQQRPEIPGTYLDIYINKNTMMMRGIGFNINHPAMVANKNQAIGPNFHIIKEYQFVNGLQIPAYYVSYGTRPEGSLTSNAVHMVFDVRFGQSFDTTMLNLSGTAKIDQQTKDWWQDK